MLFSPQLAHIPAPQFEQRLSRISMQQIRPIGKQKIARQIPQQVKLSLPWPTRQ
jgi:hypothetical protein